MSHKALRLNFVNFLIGRKCKSYCAHYCIQREFDIFLSNLLKKIISIFQFRHRMSNAAHDIEFKALSVMPLYNYNYKP